jgi:hypothetical protein
MAAARGAAWRERQRRLEKGSATVLDRKNKVGIFQQVVGEDDEFLDESSESELFGFTAIDLRELLTPSCPFPIG